MGASRAVLLPRIKPRRRYFGAGSENEDPQCTTPHPERKTRGGFGQSSASTKEGVQGSTKGRGNAKEKHNGVSTNATREPPRNGSDDTKNHLRNSKQQTSTSGSSRVHVHHVSRREPLDKLRVHSRAAGTKLVRAAVDFDHAGSVELAARDYQRALKHFDLYLQLESDKQLAQAVASKAEQYRARLGRIREVLKPTLVEQGAEESRTEEPCADDENSKATTIANDESENFQVSTKTETKKTPPTKRAPLRQIEQTNCAPGRFKVMLASNASVDTGTETQSESGEVLNSSAQVNSRNRRGRVLVGDGRSVGGKVLEDEDVSQVELTTACHATVSTAAPEQPEMSTVTDEEADAWVDEETEGCGESGETEALPEESIAADDDDTTGDDNVMTTLIAHRTHDHPTSGDIDNTEEHPTPPSTPSVASPGFRNRKYKHERQRSTHWDSEFGVFEFGDFVDDDGGASSDLYASQSCENHDVDPVDDFDKAVHVIANSFNDWFDTSLKKLDEFSQNELAPKIEKVKKTIAESNFALETENLIAKSKSLSSSLSKSIETEWRAQFPDDATYVSEMAKKEYPSEACGVMSAFVGEKNSQLGRREQKEKKGN